MRRTGQTLRAARIVRVITEGETEVLKLTVLIGLLSLFGGSAFAQNDGQAPPPEPYKKVSTLVKLPDFIPGLGTLYVDPHTLPAGPFLAYDHQGKLVSTIYMIPMKDLSDQKKFADLTAPGGQGRPCQSLFQCGPSGGPRTSLSHHPVACVQTAGRCGREVIT